MQQIHISSSLISKAEYNPESEELIVKFKSGATWKYYGVTQAEINNFILAPSQGSYFLQNIRDNKRAIKI